MESKAHKYLDFLRSPSTAVLASNASLNYITTTTSIRDPAAILKHFGAQAKQVVKKDEQIANTIENEHGVFLETVTTLEFHEGGGAYLPGIDSNLLDERTVVFPLNHVVSFAADGKIQQIRQYWDQGTLLKQVEAIGKAGRNWPIRDGKAQTDLVTNSIKSLGETAPAPSATTGPTEMAVRGGDPSKKRDNVSVPRDPRAGSDLFAVRDSNEQAARSYDGPQTATRASARPAPRDYSDFFTGEDSSAAPGSTIRSPSPHKTDGTILKAGAGKHYANMRLFDEDDEADLMKSPERKKMYDQKYEHFAFGEGEDVAKENRPVSGKGGKGHQTTFSFDDFTTPLKVRQKVRPDFERQWGTGIDADDPGSPPKRPVVHAPRPDAEAHFSLADVPEETATATAPQRQRGPDLAEESKPESRPTSKGTGLAVNKNRRGDDFEAHYAMTDEMPSNAPAAKSVSTKRGARTDMQPHWGFSDSGETEKKIYKTAGDGMGGRSGARSWAIGDEADA